MNRPRPNPDYVTIAVGAVAVLSLVAAGAALLTADGPVDGAEKIEVAISGQAPVHTGVGLPDGFTDPRGPDRGPTPLEWEVIREYKVIENMTSDSPPVTDVEHTLQRLRQYTNEHADNPYIHQLYLKGLRVAAYYADPDDSARTMGLHERFVIHAARWEHFEYVVVETMWYRLDRIQAKRGNCSPELAEMDRLFALVPENDGAANAYLSGLRAAFDSRCALTQSESVFWRDRLTETSRNRAE